ncbi:hypothetical protein CR194_19600 [Salipaludibacillus keqinensis]|uniref:G5 domain-containing protein n=1 Tax=Salipaludibacillus keqinensis TaxID=2045207 RepID=A0A323T6G0_9BACI|nr:G5 and 3D domain-containing protein [Salipaludibacillus keqinensis]PYZ91539.1 hypothetical protein CR194_19600 [Salipaludibacillus keqinensis]
MIHWMKQLSTDFSWRKLAVSSVGLLTLMSILAVAIYEVTKAEVTVEAEDDITSVFTHASTVGELLEEQEIDMGKHDYVEPSQNTEIIDSLNIVYKEAKEVIVNFEGEEQSVWTTVDTVRELFEELEVEVNDHDFIEPSLKSDLTAEMNVTFESAFQVALKSDGVEETLWTTSTTVADFLEKENVTLDELDRVEPSEEEELLEGSEVRVIRVQKVTDVVEEKMDFATVTQKDSSLKQGSEKIKNQGKEGKVERHYEVVLEDGEEVSRELLKEEIVQESKDMIVAVGTKAPTETVSRGSSSSSSSTGTSTSNSSDSSSSANSSKSTSTSTSDASNSSSSTNSSSGGSWQTFKATAYTAYCNGCSGVTAAGIDLRANPNAKVIAVDPSVIPLGSRVEVKGHGTYIAGDTGGAIKGRKIDIFIPDKDKVQSFGRKSVEIRVLD